MTDRDTPEIDPDMLLNRQQLIEFLERKAGEVDVKPEVPDVGGHRFEDASSQRDETTVALTAMFKNGGYRKVIEGRQPENGTPRNGSSGNEPSRSARPSSARTSLYQR